MKREELAQAFRGFARARPALANLLLLCFGIAMGLVAGEALLRIAPLPDLMVISAFENPPLEEWSDPEWQNPGGHAYQRHTVIGYEHAAGMDFDVTLAGHARGAFRFRTNNLGLRRDSDSPITKPPGVYRVLVLGDSQTDGYVDNAESFATLLESNPGYGPSAAGLRTEALNAGVVGYSPAQEFLWYRHRGAQLRPDLVLLVFYVGNDVGELGDPSKPTVDAATGRAVPAKAHGGPAGPGRFVKESVLDSLRLLTLARYLVRVGPLARPWRRWGLPGALTEVGGIPLPSLIEILRSCHGCFWQSLQQAMYARRDPRGVRRNLRTAGEILTRLARDVEADGGRLVVALLPTPSQVDPARTRAETERVASLLGLAESDLRFDDEVADTLADQLRRADVPTIPLREPLTAAAEAAPVFYGRDWHLNAHGHCVVAATLQRELSIRGLLPDQRAPSSIHHAAIPAADGPSASTCRSDFGPE